MSSKRLLGDVFPALVWLAVIFMLSTGTGGASHTNSFLDLFLRRHFPDFYYHLTWPQLDAIHFYIRKVAHVTEYAVLGVLTVRALHPPRSVLPARCLLLSWTLCAAYAATDEFHQVYVAGRTPKVTDALLDAAGAALGIILLRSVTVRKACSRLLS